MALTPSSLLRRVCRYFVVAVFPTASTVNYAEILSRFTAQVPVASMHISDRRALWFAYAALSTGRSHQDRWQAVKAQLERWLAIPSGEVSLVVFEEWRRVLDYQLSSEREDVILSQTPLGRRLRLVSPLGALFANEAERQRVMHLYHLSTTEGAGTQVSRLVLTE